MNADKMQFRQKEVTHMGHSTYPNKLWAINDMPAPTDNQGVQRILGIVNYLQKFAPDLADLVKPLGELIKKENEFAWEKKVHGKCLEKVKP